MGQCVLSLYRDASQPAMVWLGERVIVGQPRNGMVFIADADHFAGTVLMMEEMAETLDASVALMSGRGHWWMIEDPDTAATHLCRHWANAAS
jgi:hypothetical protein